MTHREDWSFPFEGPLHEVFPALHEAQNAWMSQIDSLRAPDRKTHELIRLACTVILRNPQQRGAIRVGYDSEAKQIRTSLAADAPAARE